MVTITENLIRRPINGCPQYTKKFSKLIFFIVVVLLTRIGSAFCGENYRDIGAEFTDAEYKSHIKEFQKVFGRKLEHEFGLKWLEGGFTHHYYNDEPEFYAYRRASLEEARALAVAIILKLSEAVHADPIMLSYLSKSSSSPDFLGADIRFVNSGNWSYEDGSIDRVHSYYSERDTSGVKKLNLRYESTDPFRDISDFKNIDYSKIEESFEDAVKLNAANINVSPAIHKPNAFEDELYRILTSFKEEMKAQHGFYFRSSAWVTKGKFTPDICEIRTKCTYYYPVDIHEARSLILLATEKLLTALNSSETLKPYLKDYPFSAAGVKLRILFREYKYFVGDSAYYDGSMESAVLSENTVSYYHHIRNKNSDMHDRVIYAEESYQEAQKALQNTPLFSKFENSLNYFFTNFKNLIDGTVFFFFYVLMLTMIFPQVWLFIIPLIILLLVLYRKHRSSKVYRSKL